MSDKKKLSLDDLASNSAKNAENEEQNKNVAKPEDTSSTSTSAPKDKEEVKPQVLNANTQVQQPENKEQQQQQQGQGQPTKKKMSIRDLVKGDPSKKGIDNVKLMDQKDFEEVSEKVEYIDPVKRNWEAKSEAIDRSIDRVKKDLKENLIEPLRKETEEKLNQALLAQDEAIFSGEAVLENDKRETNEVNANTNTTTSETAETTTNDPGTFSLDDNADPLKDSLKEESASDDELNALLGPSAKIPGHTENTPETIKIDTTPVEEDDEMKNILRELDDGYTDEDDAPESENMEDAEEDLSQLTPEEKKRQDEWAKQMIESYTKGLRDALEKKGKVKASSKDVHVTNYAVSFTQVLKDLKNEDMTHTASFPLIHTGRMIRMRALTGDEIPDLDYSNYASDLEASRAMYNLLYRHDVSANKPSSFNEWLKSICDWDIFNIYMCLYIATFRESNFVPYNCPQCDNMFFEERPVEDMYRKHQDASENFDERVKKIKEMGDSSFESSTKPVYTPISSRFGIDLRAPSIYSATFETVALEPAFRSKHTQAINLIPFIGDIYMVRTDPNGKLERSKINFKIDRDNETKSVKLKIIALEKIISSLTTDEAAAMAAKIGAINNKRRDRYEFLIPGTTCHQHYGPKKDANGVNLEGQECGHVINEIVRRRDGNTISEVNPLDLLFTRHRLTQFAYFEIE